VRTTLIGGEKKMLVWNDLEVDEKIKIYDRGVNMSSARASITCSSATAPRHVVAEGGSNRGPEAELAYFVKCIETGEPPINDGLPA